MPVSREEVVHCYRSLLGREPESEFVIDDSIANHGNFRMLVATFVASPEFRSCLRRNGQQLRLDEAGIRYRQLRESFNRGRSLRGIVAEKLRHLKLPFFVNSSDDVVLIRRIIAENAARHWRGYALGLLMTVILAGCTAFTAYLIGSIVNATFLKQSFAAVAALSAAWIALFAIRGFATYWQDVLVAGAGNKITAESQRRLFDKLLGQGVPYFADRHSTEFMANAALGTGSIANILNQLVLTLGRDLFAMIGLVGLMVWQDPLLSLISFAVLPPALVGVETLAARARTIAATQFYGSAAMLATMQEAVQGFRIVKAFNLEGAVRARVEDNIVTLERAANELARVANRSTPLLETFGGMAIGLACLYGGYRVVQANASPGELVSFMMAFILTFEPVRRMARLKIDLGSSLVVARTLYRVFDAPPVEGRDSTKPAMAVTGGRVAFAAVDFAYRPNVPVLRGMSFAAEPGRLTALVGPSGGGKTTVFNLLLRFYDAGHGQITIDGTDLRAVTRSSLRAQIAYMGQEIYLFNGTIRENILVGRPDADADALLAAAKASFAHDFIMALPRGYDSQVGEQGSELSLGQRQRIAVARALIKDAPIVLLDEPTASLDSESEAHVQEAIRRLCAGKTTIAIAHRLNTIRDADCIHVVENGAIVESGRHEQLLRQNGRYATFFRIQFPEALALS